MLISYSHDSAEHGARVLELANRLRRDGVDCDLDQYVAGGAPADGWPLWMQNRIEQCDFTLMVCTATYTRRVMHREALGVGRGVLWEATLLYNLLYHDDAFRARAVPVLLAGSTVADIPLPFRDFYCDLSSAGGYDMLVNKIFRIPSAVKPQLGDAPVRPPADAPPSHAPVPSAASFDPPVLETLRAQLGVAIGPIAQHLVAVTAQHAADLPDLIEQLAAQIDSNNAAHAFRERARDALRIAPDPPPAASERARRELGALFGPMSGSLVADIGGNFS